MKRTLIIAIAALTLIGGGYFLFGPKSSEAEIEYRYSKIEKGELVRSISANGVLVALTTVDVKSKAGGKVVRLAVDEGAEVKQGDLIAEIDPSDTQSTFDQAAADVQAAQARVTQATANASLEGTNSSTSIADARLAVATAKSRLDRAEQLAGAQPNLSQAELNSAQANLTSQREALKQLEAVTIPREMQEARVAVDRAQSEFASAQAELNRQRELLEKGYTSLASVERAQSTFSSAKASLESAETRLKTMGAQHASDLATQRARVRDAEAGLERAKANQYQVPTSKMSLQEARESYQQALVALRRAQASPTSVRSRQAEIATARANTVRSQVALKNAKVQLDSTTVVAPRDGVVTLKYLEEGTIIPPGTSTFAQGTSLVQLSDTTRMFVECQVDEADIGQIKEGQTVRVLLEAFPSEKLRGKVIRVNPSAATANNITAIKVRVEVTPSKRARLMPGMTATCEFLTLEKKDVIVVPSQAVKHEGDKNLVKVKTASGKNETREVELGETGNDGIEVISGLQVGDEVVVAEIDLKAMRELQERMEQAQQGGGFAGGRTGGPSGSRASGGGGAGGGGGGGGGGRGGGGGGR